ncbi:MAG: DUF3604 domain-containing protein [Gammaproteobacteria bacterium]|nr:DUF3604 domain-containing protein [Gammaproteobacteria bacterium]
MTLLAAGCEQAAEPELAGVEAKTPEHRAAPASAAGASAPRHAYFGDLHIHTQYSVDAYNFGVRATPDDAYRFAKGEALAHPLGHWIRLQGRPLDFLAVTDHAEYLGVARALADPGHPLGSHPVAVKLRSGDPTERWEAGLAIDGWVRGKPVSGLDPSPIVRSVWQETVAAAERHDDPGRFTTFVAYEFSSTPGGVNLHRNVIFSGNDVPALPFSAVDSLNPEDLWTWLDEQRANGIEALAIPHNSNWSQGKMFDRTDWAGEPIDAAYAEQRRRNEPLVEITQGKGTSETHPALSPNDEWADFELWRKNSMAYGEDGSISFVEGATTGAFARDALRAGLEIEREIAANPYLFGFIGASDGHNAAGSVEEDQHFGHTGMMDGTPAARGSLPDGRQGQSEIPLELEMIEWGSSGLTGVWAEENTRESIYAAFRRKEAFATSGPRIRVRFFAGYDYSDDLPNQHHAAERAYAGGVPMGGELAAQPGNAPRFFVQAARDPREAWLQRAQVVKSWIDESGETHERVFDVACSNGLTPDPQTHRCPDNGARVDLDDCSISLDKGDVELATLWSDPTFDPTGRALYYARVLQNPTCRWSTWDAIRAGVEPTSKVPATIQERAWSSPIWIAPAVR